MHSLARSAAAVAVLALPPTALAQSGGTVTVLDGCGLAPLESLVLEAGSPELGSTLTLTAFDTVGETQPGSGLAQIGLSIAPLLPPCGLPLAGYGAGDAAGPLLVDIGSALFANSGFGPIDANGSSLPYVVPVPNNPSLIGFQVFSQGLLFDAVTFDFLVTNGLAFTFGEPLEPNLRVFSVSADRTQVDLGGKFELAVVITNTGSGDAPLSSVEVCSESGWCDSVTVPALPAGATAVVRIDLEAPAGAEGANPHFFTATVDPSDVLAESEELDNALSLVKPVLVVDPILIEPVPIPDSDEVFLLEGGAPAAYERTDYDNGEAPSENDLPTSPNKGGPNPGTGELEPLGNGAPPAPKVDPLVFEANESLEGEEFIEYVVNYRHAVPMPVLPDLDATLDRFSPSNMAALEQRIALFEGVRRARIEQVQPLLEQIQSEFNAKILEHFALAGAFSVAAPRELLDFLANEDQVLHVQAIEVATPPPDPMSDARDRINSDAYFNAGARGVAFIAVLDSGVDTTHVLLDDPNPLYFDFDCVNGNSRCENDGDPNYDPSDPFWNHGTKTASVLSANGNLGDADRGITESGLDNYSIYGPNGYDLTAILRAFDDATLWGAKIIVGEIQANEDPTQSIAQAADSAYDAGVAVISANGNFGADGPGTVGSPGNAHKGLGIGAYDVSTGKLEGYSGLGPTTDDRYKPELITPVNLLTANVFSDTFLQNFSGTSCATPVAAGAASVYADWFRLGSQAQVNAGKLYAGLLAAGNRDWNDPFDNQVGLGELRLPTSARVFFAVRNISQDQNKSVTVVVGENDDTIEAAIWWPEASDAAHADIDLYLEDDGGTIFDASLSAPSVFEAVRLPELAPGTYELRINGFDMPEDEKRTVYLSAIVR